MQKKKRWTRKSLNNMREIIIKHTNQEKKGKVRLVHSQFRHKLRPNGISAFLFCLNLGKKKVDWHFG